MDCGEFEVRTGKKNGKRQRDTREEIARMKKGREKDGETGARRDLVRPCTGGACLEAGWALLQLISSSSVKVRKALDCFEPLYPHLRNGNTSTSSTPLCDKDQVELTEESLL